MKDVLQKPNTSIVLTELLNGKKKMTDLQERVKNYASLKLLVLELEKEGYVNIEESKEGKRVIYVSLTEKGLAVAEKLKEAEEISMEDEKYYKLFNKIRVVTVPHRLNDYILLRTEEGKEIRIYFIIDNANTLFLWCDQHKDFECEHIKFLFKNKKIKKDIIKFANQFGLEIWDNYLGDIKKSILKIFKRIKSDDDIKSPANESFEPRSYNTYLKGKLNGVIESFEDFNSKEDEHILANARKLVFEITYLLGEYPENLILPENETLLKTIWKNIHEKLEKDDLAKILFSDVYTTRYFYLESSDADERRRYREQLRAMAAEAYDMYLAWWSEKKEEVYGE